MTSKLEIRGKEVELCEQMRLMRNAYRGIDEIRAQRSEEFRVRLRAIRDASIEALKLEEEMQ